jgi:hypothetical protein
LPLCRETIVADNAAMSLVGGPGDGGSDGIAGAEAPSAAAAAPAAALAPFLLPQPVPAAGAAPDLTAPSHDRRPVARHHLLVLAFALAGGALGVLGAVFEELRAGGFAFLAAGVIEEALKPSGVYVVLVKWPWALRGRVYTASMTALSGFVFGVIEALVYVLVYFPDEGSDFVLYRFTVPLIVHSGCSFIFGLGIDRSLVDWANGLASFPQASLRFIVAAMTLHAGFNLVALVLQVSGVVHFS